ncbi:hypothetical protein [Methylobacterium sp. Leaf99]|uniref:hypothetical protein n=1 Tax=Methylobacterium sp. Leaf99 TaxID=1736251 RepID=UPI0012ED4335|nr:hypothetical protein [Methylobacterium sp. Leaf99]
MGKVSEGVPAVDVIGDGKSNYNFDQIAVLCGKINFDLIQYQCRFAAARQTDYRYRPRRQKAETLSDRSAGCKSADI